MSKKPEILYVTPPDLYLPTAGIRVFYLGGPGEWKSQVQKLVDEYFRWSDITHYHLTDSATDSTIPWVNANIGHCDFVIINLDLINPVELAFAFSRCKEDNTWFYTELSKNKSILRVLNTVGKCPMFDSMDTLAHALKIEGIGNDE